MRFLTFREGRIQNRNFPKIDRILKPRKLVNVIFPDRSGSGDDEDDVNDFIVDEEGKPIEKKKSKKRHIFEDSQRQLAEDIFGVAFDYEVRQWYWIYTVCPGSNDPT